MAYGAKVVQPTDTDRPDWKPPPLVHDVVQDHPATWDWRLIAAFVVAGCCVLFFT